MSIAFTASDAIGSSASFSASSGRWQDLGLPPNSPAMLDYAPTATGGSIIWTTPDPYGGTTALYTAIYS